MADTAVFDLACETLERLTSLDRLEARGTVRLALKQAGLESRSVNHEQMAVMARKILPAELVSRGIEDAEHVCAELAAGLGRVDASPAQETPEAVFHRLGG